VKRYQFRLHTVLRLRRAEEEQAREVLATANRLLRERVQARNSEIARYVALTGRAHATTVDGLRSETLEAGLLASVVTEAKKATTVAAADAAFAHVNWAGTMRRVKVLERLDDRRRVEHAEDEQRSEIATIDDIVTARFVSDHQPDDPSS